MKKSDVLEYVSHCIDDCGAVRSIAEIPDNAVFVGWRCGFEPMFVAVWSGYGWQLDENEAEELAADYLQESKWFVGSLEVDHNADYILTE